MEIEAIDNLEHFIAYLIHKRFKNTDMAKNNIWWHKQNVECSWSNTSNNTEANPTIH